MIWYRQSCSKTTSCTSREVYHLCWNEDQIICWPSILTNMWKRTLASQDTCDIQVTSQHLKSDVSLSIYALSDLFSSEGRVHNTLHEWGLSCPSSPGNEYIDWHQLSGGSRDFPPNSVSWCPLTRDGNLYICKACIIIPHFLLKDVPS